jgi:hypothetical protein
MRLFGAPSPRLSRGEEKEVRLPGAIKNTGSEALAIRSHAEEPAQRGVAKDEGGEDYFVIVKILPVPLPTLAWVSVIGWASA